MQVQYVVLARHLARSNRISKLYKRSGITDDTDIYRDDTDPFFPSIPVGGVVGESVLSVESSARSVVLGVQNHRLR